MSNNTEWNTIFMTDNSRTFESEKFFVVIMESKGMVCVSNRHGIRGLTGCSVNPTSEKFTSTKPNSGNH